ncbi:MAG: DoxX family protein [Terracidiphilus sp.]
MTNLDRFMEFLAAGVFLCFGIGKMLSYRRRPKPLGARHRDLPLGLPYGIILVIGLFEALLALAIVAPTGPSLPVALPLVAASALALLTAAAVIYHVRRRETAVPSMALFLLALFVIVGHTL